MRAKTPEMRFTLARRHMLQMLGAAALSAPFAPLLRRTAHAVDGVAPKRLIVFWTPNGSIQEEVWPTGTRDSFTLGPMMEPLTPYRDDLTILKGITFEGTGDHKTGMPFSTTGFSGQNAGISIDQEVAQAKGTSSSTDSRASQKVRAASSTTRPSCGPPSAPTATTAIPTFP